MAQSETFNSIISRSAAGPLMPEQTSNKMLKHPQCPTSKPYAAKDNNGKIVRCHPTPEAAKAHMASLGMDTAIRTRAGR